MLLRRHKMNEAIKNAKIKEKKAETAETTKPKSKKKAETEKKGG